MRVLVTGANGLLATHVIKLLAESDIPVVGMIRNRKKFLLPLTDGIELRVGDIGNPNDVEECMRGCTHVIHAAAFTSQREVVFDAYQKVNVKGTENLLLAAAKANIRRFVFVSTANTLGYGTHESPGSELMPMLPPFTRSFYGRSKQMAEKLVNNYRDRLDIVTVHPSFMIGPFDAAPSSGQIFSAVVGRRVVFYPPGGKNFVHVADVATGVKNALLFGERGEKYLLGNKNLSYRQFFKKVLMITGQRAWLVPIPPFVLVGFGVVGDLLRLFRIKTMLSSANMRILCVKNFYSNDKAKRELGLTFQSTEAAISEALAWWQSQNENSFAIQKRNKKADVSTGSLFMSSTGN